MKFRPRNALHAFGAAFAVLATGACGGGGNTIDKTAAPRALLNNVIASGDLAAITKEYQKGINANTKLGSGVLRLPKTIGTVEEVMAGPVGVDGGRVRIVGNTNNGVIYWAFNLDENNADDTGKKSPTEIALAIKDGAVSLAYADDSGTWGQRWNGASTIHLRAKSDKLIINDAVEASSSYFGIPDTTALSSRKPSVEFSGKVGTSGERVVITAPRGLVPN